MNYRHVYHAGNFADVLKHAVLALVIEHLKKKDAAFRVIDTHAGPGLYELSDERSQRTGEWVAGIGRIAGAAASAAPKSVEALIAPYLGAVKAFNPPSLLTRYPGSPRIARALMRPQDRLVVNELHKEDAAALRRVMGRDAQTTVMEMDGWIALKALLPPKERRGVILIDPPFEEPGELKRMPEALRDAVKRFATGIYILWYPIKDRGALRKFVRQMTEMNLGPLLQIELELTPAESADRLAGTGLLVLNPPFQLDGQARKLLPWLATSLAGETKPSWTIDWLTPPK